MVSPNAHSVPNRLDVSRWVAARAWNFWLATSVHFPAIAAVRRCSMRYPPVDSCGPLPNDM